MHTSATFEGRASGALHVAILIGNIRYLAPTRHSTFENCFFNYDKELQMRPPEKPVPA